MDTKKWYLSYTGYDAMERMGNEIQQVEIPLSSTEELSAIEEAKVKWSDIVTKETTYWEKQKNEWAHPPKKPFNDVEPRPFVVYKISLQ